MRLLMLFFARQRRSLQRMYRYFILFLSLWLVAGCGKREEPTTPYSVPSAFPRTYPPLDEEEADSQGLFSF